VLGSPIYSVLNDTNHARLEHLDRDGVEVHLLSLTPPGVQMFHADTACAIASLANDRMVEAIARHRGRYAGLAAVARPRRRGAEQVQSLKLADAFLRLQRAARSEGRGASHGLPG